MFYILLFSCPLKSKCIVEIYFILLKLNIYTLLYLYIIHVLKWYNTISIIIILTIITEHIIRIQIVIITHRFFLNNPVQYFKLNKHFLFNDKTFRLVLLIHCKMSVSSNR